MAPTRIIFTIVLLCQGLYLAPTQATTIEYVSRDQAKSLADEYSKAQPLDETFVKELSGKELSCDMYGMRSRLQVERNVKLYRFSAIEGGFKNAGAQVVSHYEIRTGRFLGRRGHLVDEIRNSKGDILAQLALSPTSGVESDRGPVVIAYSRCKL